LKVEWKRLVDERCHRPSRSKQLRGLEVKTSADFKARLYERYLTEHVRSSAENIRVSLVQRGPYLRKMIGSYLPSDKSARILDLGCGYGGIMHALREAGYANVTGVDVSPEQIDVARRLGFEDVHCKDVRAFLSEAADASYNVVIAFDILEHFTKPELLGLTDELHRVLARGGRLIVHAPNGEAIFPGTVLHGDLTHELAFTRSSLHQLAGATGFRVIAVKEDVPVVHGLKSLMRYLIWGVGSLFFRLLAAAETGAGFRDKPLSQNLLAILESV
jgi:2-polyprenyl-3-methyl-5-hydroxy-6-metoxy-1,4-benzoquinol methylase